MYPQNQNTETINVLADLEARQQALDQQWSQLGQPDESLSIEQRIEMEKDKEIIESFIQQQATAA